MNNNTGFRLALLASAAIGQMALASHAAAQSAAPADAGASNVEEIVVTGSQIRGVAPVGSSLIGLTSDAIKQTPVSTTTDLLRQVPQIVALGADETGGRGGIQGSAQNRTSGSSINLRGLGPNATLLLVNGQRLAPAGYNGTFADASVIATEAIERVEIVADGASAIYGSDAIAGVVNLILRKNFQGVRTSVQFGGADGFSQSRQSIVGGHSWSSGSASLSYEHNLRTALSASDRPFYTSDFRGFGGPDRRSLTSVPGNITIAGVSYAIPDQDGRNLTAAQLAAGRGLSNRIDGVQLGEIVPRQERNNVTFSMEQRVTPKVKFLLDAFWSRREVRSSGQPGGNITVSNNPAAANYSQFFNSPIPGFQSGIVAYSFSKDLPPTTSEGVARQYRGNVAFEIELPRNWRLVPAVTYSKSIDQAPRVNGFSVFSGFINPLLRDPNPATALNVFGNGGDNNPATLAKLFQDQFESTGIGSIADYSIKADGTLLTLPAGDVKLAVGYSRRRETQSLEEATSVNATLTKQPSLSIHGVRYVDAFFAEAFVPLVGGDAGLPLMRQLDLSLAARSENYSDFGKALNPKIGVNWRPFDDLLVRGSYGKSFRAPALNYKNPIGTQLGTGTNIADPKSPTGFTRGFIRTGGNANIGPERSRTFSLGADYKPAALPGLSASLNYDIYYYGKIGQAGGGQSTPALSQEAYYAPYIERNPTPARVQEILNLNPLIPAGTIDPTTILVIVDARANNIGKAEIRGVDFNLGYRFTLGRVAFDVSETGTYYTKYDNATTMASPYQDVLNTINWPTRWRSQTRATARLDGFSATAFVNYTPSYTNNLVVPEEKVSDYTTIDGQLSFDTGASRPYWLRDIVVSLNFSNLFDSDPPYVNNTSGIAYDPQLASPLGRVVSLQVSKRW
jgi:iron complex outermembrane receptor protein